MQQRGLEHVRIRRRARRRDGRVGERVANRGGVTGRDPEGGAATRPRRREPTERGGVGRLRVHDGNVRAAPAAQRLRRGEIDAVHRAAQDDHRGAGTDDPARVLDRAEVAPLLRHVAHRRDCPDR